MSQWGVSLTHGYSVPCSGLTPPHRGHGPLAPFSNGPVSLHIDPDRLVVVLEARHWRDVAGGQFLAVTSG